MVSSAAPARVKSKQASARIKTPKASNGREVLAEPGDGFGHHLTEGRLDINLVVTKAAQGHEFLGSPALANSASDSSGGTRRSSSVVMNRIGRGAILSTTHSG